MNNKHTKFGHYITSKRVGNSSIKITLLVILLGGILISCDPIGDGTTDGSSGATSKGSLALK